MSDGLDQFVAEAPHAAAMFDREMRCVAASPRWLADFGLRNLRVGWSLYEACPAIGDAWKAIFRRCLAGATEQGDGERFERADGVVRWIEWETRPWRDRDGAIGGIVFATADVTARVEAQERAEALARRIEEDARRAEAAERRLRDVIDTLPAGFDLYDANDRLIVSNAAAEAMYPHTVEARRPGISFEDLLRIGVELRIHGPDASDNERWLRERMERHRNPSGAIDQLTADGRWLRIEERPLSDGGVLVIRSDVTDIKAREQEFAERTAVLEATLRAMGEGIIVFGPDLRLKASNDVAGRILQAPAELLKPGTPFEKATRFRIERGDFGDDDVESQIAYHVSRFRAQRPWSERRRRRDGRIFEIRFHPTPDGGGIFMFRDVTESANQDAALARKSALLEATLENMGEGVAVFDADRRLMVVNETAARLLALPPALRAPGASFDEVIRFRAAQGDAGRGDVEAFVAERAAWFRAPAPFIRTRRLGDGRTIDIRFNPLPDGGSILVFRDVTERADAEAKLAERTTVLEATLHNMGEGVVVFGPDYRLMSCNGVASEMLGLPAALLRPGTTFEDVVRFRAERGDLGEVDIAAYIRERIAWSGSALTWTRRIRDGRIVEGRFHPLPGGGGVHLFRDVTERVEYETKLAERTALLETTFANMGEGIAVFDANHKLVIANEDSVVRLLGVPPELVRPGARHEDLTSFRVGRGDYDGMSAHSIYGAREAAFRAGKTLLMTGGGPDGRTIDTRINPMPGGGVVLVFRDVTKRQQAVDTLRASEERFRLLIEEAPDAILLYDCGPARYVAANRAAERLFGVPRDALLEHGPLPFFGLPQPDALPPQQSYDAHIERARAGEQANFERRILRPSGEERLCRVTLVRLESKVHLVRASFVDVTDQAAAEARLSEVLRSVVDRQEAERQRIARNLHDTLGQYLAVMNVRLSVLDSQAADPVTVKSGLQDLKALTATVGTEVHYLAWELRPIALDDLGLGPAIRHYVEEWARRSGLKCDVHLALKVQRLPANVETTLYRVLQEGLTNIVKHARAKTVGVVLEASPNVAVMIVEDDGVGFEPERLDRASPRLGLRGMRERLAAIRGSLEIESRPGGGTTLITRVPLDGAAGPSPEQA